MDQEQIINQYKANSENEQILFVLKDDRVVVGQEVDEENKLYYVIRDGDNYVIESAWNQQVAQTMRVDSSASSTQKIKL